MQAPQHHAGNQAGIGSHFVIALRAKPNQINIDVQRTALLVVDMQNAFTSKEGLNKSTDSAVKR
jgi:isochorismate hydrolase